MKRRGKCRCGAILDFPLTSRGYKTRCVGCGAVVRLRDAASADRGRARKAPSATFAAVGLPPLPETDTEVIDFSASSLPPAVDAFDFVSPHEKETDAPMAAVELEAFTDTEPARKPSILPWIVFGLLTLLVGLGVGVAAM